MGVIQVENRLVIGQFLFQELGFGMEKIHCFLKPLFKPVRGDPQGLPGLFHRQSGQAILLCDSDRRRRLC